MANLSLPNYGEGQLINPEVLKDLTNDDFFEGYLIVNGAFMFPDGVKYLLYLVISMKPPQFNP